MSNFKAENTNCKNFWFVRDYEPGSLRLSNLTGSTTFRRDFFGANILCFLLTLTQSPNPNPNPK